MSKEKGASLNWRKKIPEEILSREKSASLKGGFFFPENIMSKEKKADFTLKKKLHQSDFQTFKVWIPDPIPKKKLEKFLRQSDFQTFKVWKSEAPKVWKVWKPIFNSFLIKSRVQTQKSEPKPSDFESLKVWGLDFFHFFKKK